MGYCIRQDAQKGNFMGVQYLFMVDRGKTKRLFWTSDDESILLVYRKKSAAEFALKRMKHNNPTLVDSKTAIEQLRSQKSSINSFINDFEDSHLDDDPSWDAHKYL